MADVTTVLDTKRIDDLKKGYDEQALNTALATTLENEYSQAGKYAQSILSIFYTKGSGIALKDDGRERCIISMLASHRERFPLAVHIYIGLMEGLTPTEVADILLLTAVYTGVDTFTDGVAVARDTFEALKTCCAANKVTSGDVVRELRARFQPASSP